jgi:hypothetical protein
MVKRFMVSLALIATWLGIVAGAGSVANAQVTNCWRTNIGSNAVTGNCTGTTANAPYTTQFALMLQCTNGHTYTSGWKTAGIYSAALVQCASGSRISSWFLFR